MVADAVGHQFFLPSYAPGISPKPPSQQTKCLPPQQRYLFNSSLPDPAPRSRACSAFIVGSLLASLWAVSFPPAERLARPGGKGPCTYAPGQQAGP